MLCRMPLTGSGNRAFDQGAASGWMDREAAERGTLGWALTDGNDARRRLGGASRTGLLPEPLG